jgi:serine/threonine protein kinase
MFEELRHVNIIGFYGASIEKVAGKLYFCTEFATNGSLYDFLHSKRSAEYFPETVSRWSIEIASGMEYLSEKNILHRDLKSANILLTRVGLVSTAGSEATSPVPDGVDVKTPLDERIRRDGQSILDDDTVGKGGDRSESPLGEDSSALICKICDFGLSHKVSKPKGSTVGTVRWMAPEALKRSEITLKSDVYSFGVVLWEMVARRRPWRDFTDPQVHAAIVSFHISLRRSNPTLMCLFFPALLLIGYLGCGRARRTVEDPRRLSSVHYGDPKRMLARRTNGSTGLGRPHPGTSSAHPFSFFA